VRSHSQLHSCNTFLLPVPFEHLTPLSCSRTRMPARSTLPITTPSTVGVASRRMAASYQGLLSEAYSRGNGREWTTLAVGPRRCEKLRLAKIVQTRMLATRHARL
jgi:hypothetical protein